MKVKMKAGILKNLRLYPAFPAQKGVGWGNLWSISHPSCHLVDIPINVAVITVFEPIKPRARGWILVLNQFYDRLAQVLSSLLCIFECIGMFHWSTKRWYIAHLSARAHWCITFIFQSRDLIYVNDCLCAELRIWPSALCYSTWTFVIPSHSSQDTVIYLKVLFRWTYISLHSVKVSHLPVHAIDGICSWLYMSKI